MKLKLKDFRCYENACFDFGDGLVLISGMSGIGKSSIFMAINFVLFGTGTKIIMHGKSSCLVEFEFDGLKVVRTKKPNRLVVNEVYEDEVGQEIINKKFGNTFDVSGYISQNAVSSFIMMSPIEKLNFLEKFAFSDVDLVSIKKKCKDITNTRHENMNISISKLELSMNMLQEMKKPEEVIFPIKCSTRQQEKATQIEEVKNKNCTIMIKKTLNKIKKLQTELHDLNILQNSLTINQDTIEDLKKRLESLIIEKNDIEYEGEQKLEEYKKILKSIVVKRDLTNFKLSYEDELKRFTQIQDEERLQIKDELENINNSLWKEYSKEEVDDMINDCKLNLQLIHKVNSFEIELKKYIIDDVEDIKGKLDKCINDHDLKKAILDKIIFQKEVYSCPSCSSKLKIQDNKLCLIKEEENTLINKETEDNITKDLKRIKLQIKQFETLIIQIKHNKEKKEEVEKCIHNIKSQFEDFPNEKEVNEDLEYLQKYKIQQNMNEKRKNELDKKYKSNLLSSSLLKFKNDIDTKLRVIKKLEEELHVISGMVDEKKEEIYTEKEIIDIVGKQEKNKSKVDNVNKNLKVIKKDLETKELVVIHDKEKFIKTYGEIRDLDTIKNNIKEEEENINTLENKKKQHENNLNTIEKYKKYLEDLTKYNNWVKKVEELTVQEKIDRDLYSSALGIKDKILEAESIALYNIIQSINLYTQSYLDHFFTENPISIKLCPFKESKKNTKPQINVEVEYKGMDCDLLSLSGGELSRVVLAFTLGLAEIFNTPLLLLDESTASLDQEITSVVFNTIRENFKGRLMIAICHNCVEGLFDKVIKL
jgi:DNA repair exonuclease SbcCD ATPase subunit